MNPIFEAYKQSDLFGKLIFIALFFLSIATWIVFLKKWFYQRELKKKASVIMESFQKKRHSPLSCDLPFSEHPFTEVHSACKQHTLQLLNKNKLGLKAEDKVFLSRSDIDLIDASLNPTLSNQLKFMEKNLFVLSTVASLAPFLGLLGTVWGILLTFSHLQSSANAHSLVMDGLAMALGTTVVGLLVAIPALIGFNYLRNAVNSAANEIEDFSRLILVSIELNYRKIDL